jgi:hypothetical protein
MIRPGSGKRNFVGTRVTYFFASIPVLLKRRPDTNQSLLSSAKSSAAL